MPRPLVLAQFHRVSTTTSDTFFYATSLDGPAGPMRVARCCCGWRGRSGSEAGITASVRGHLEAVAQGLLADLDDVTFDGEPPPGD